MGGAMILLLILATTPFLADRIDIIREDNQSIIHLMGNVKIEDENTEIICREAKLNQTAGLVVLIQDVKITDRNGEIYSDWARYYFNSQKGYLKGNIMLLARGRTIKAESLYYDGINEYVEMFHDVTIEDPENKMISHSERGWYDLGKEEGHLVETPRLEILRDERAPMTIEAREFHLIIPASTLFGYDSITVVIDTILIYCDTISYNLKTEHGTMANPIIVEHDNHLTGASGDFQMKNKEIEYLTTRDGWSIYHTKEGSVNVVEGAEIRIIFDKARAVKITVRGEPHGNLTLKRTTEENVSD
jgi:lipopolysaccharide assembly outer membrane protein LptD (OstA)